MGGLDKHGTTLMIIETRLLTVEEEFINIKPECISQGSLETQNQHHLHGYERGILLSSWPHKVGEAKKPLNQYVVESEGSLCLKAEEAGLLLVYLLVQGPGHENGGEGGQGSTGRQPRTRSPVSEGRNRCPCSRRKIEGSHCLCLFLPFD